MKLKVKPEDFVVEEILKISPQKSGDYTLLKLKKQFWNTLDVINFVAKKMKVSKTRFSRAGLKDRYALSTQYLSFRGDFKEKFEEKNFEIIPVGKISVPLSPDLLKGNRFSITLRSLTDNEVEKIYKNYPRIIEDGLPNYFDEQRFGSARHRQGFFARLLMLGHYRGALRLLLCYPSQEDNPQLKRFKNFCRDNWGKWESALNFAPHEFKEVINYLEQKPNDFKGAIKKIDREMLNLYLLAYQSYIFNQTLGLIIKDYGLKTFEVPYSMGNFVFYEELRHREAIENLFIPMLNEKVVVNGYIGKIINRVLFEEGVRLKDFSLSNMRFRGVRFKSFLRPALVFPEEFKIGGLENDEIYKNRKKLTLNFMLNSGSYATLVIKRLLA
ncbi:MAG: tRNA pseudouridine(13) synthase TruD [candidate division WOR-3 bacterium]